MQIKVANVDLAQMRTHVRRAGYGEIHTREGVISYVRRLRGLSYPRFHAYLEVMGDAGSVINLHLDQKQPSYEGAHAHSGEYDGPMVQEEARRIAAVIRETRSV